MAGTNRKRKLPLKEAWSHYWSILFPDGNDWQADLEAEIRKHLYFPGESGLFQNGGNLERTPPTWAVDLELSIKDASVALAFMNVSFGKVPLFLEQLIPALSNWQDNNPFKNAREQSALSDRDRKLCQDLFHAVVRNCGNKIQNRLLGILKETEQPDFEIYCRPSGDVFAKAQRLPTFGLNTISSIDIANNELKDRLGLPKYRHVHIKQRKPTKSKVGPHGSLRELDAPLVEEMKRLIDNGIEPNPHQAALAVLSQASRKGNSTDASVERRLQKNFSEKYPNYLIRRGGKQNKLA